MAHSRVESFIEHQDTCGAVKHKSMQSEGANCESRKLPILHHEITDGISYDSRSQSSDTAQAMSFAHSGMSDTAARSADSSQALPTADFDDRSRRIEITQQTTTTAAYNAAMPAWLMEVRGNNKLEPLLQPVNLPSLPTNSAANSDFPEIRRIQSCHIGRVVAVDCSRSPVTRSINSAGPEFSFTESKTSILPEDPSTPSLHLSIGPSSVRTTGSVDQVSTSVDMHIPCLQLSIGRTSSAEMAASSCTSSYADTKPAASFGREKLAFGSSSHQSFPAAVGIFASRVLDYKQSSSHPAGNDLALWIPEVPAAPRNQTMEGPVPGTTPDQAAASLRDFLAQAWRPGAMQSCVSR